MIVLRTRRSHRVVLAGFAAGLLIAGPSVARAQDSTQVPKTHLVKKGDTLWDLAAHYLGDAFRWPELYKLNTDIVEDPHWIYPGEILKLPGYVAVTTPGLAEPGKGVVEITPPTTAAIDSQQPAPVQRPMPNTFRRNQNANRAVSAAAPVAGDTTMRPTTPAQRPTSSVKFGDYLRAPYLSSLKGEPVWGRIVGSAEIPGIDPARQRSRFQLNDRILIAPPTGYVGQEKELYLAYHNGPLLEDVGQLIVPTGVVEVIKPPVGGDAAIARVVRMFGEVSERDRLMPYDSSVVSITGSPTPVKNGKEGEVRWVLDEPVLPSVNYFIVLSLSAQDGLKPGDEVELFRPRQNPRDEGQLGTPEITIGRAQVIRVTPFGSTAMITRLDQPKVSKGTAARVIAKMQ